MFDKTFTDYPEMDVILPLSDRLIYSSSLVEQTYYHMFGNKILQNAPDKYKDLSVLHKRLNGVGTSKITEKPI